jgi:signal transduction histidine kinase
MRRLSDAADPRRGDLERLCRVVDDAASDIREVISALHAPADAGGVAMSLGAYLRDLVESTGVEIGFNVMGSMRPRPDVEAAVFHFTRDALEDALQRSEGKRIRVELSLGSRATRLRVIDSGKVVPDNARVSALQRRAADVDGKVSLARLPNGGTIVEFECPTKRRE